MDSNARFKSSLGFIDLLFNILLGFAFLFIIAFLLIKPEAKKKDFDRRAEFVIILEWDHDAPDDLDLYVQDPTNDKVSFRLPIANYMHLDKDDLGKRNDTIINADGSTSTVMINREVVTIRGIMAGEYIINAHYYSTRVYNGSQLEPNERTIDYRSKPQRALTVKIELHKVTPYKILWAGEKKFTHRGQEETFLRFRLDADGNIIPPFTFEPKEFVTPLMGMGNYTTPIGDRNSYDAESVEGF
tara:strand:+ start:232 stop:960 length:729 start_codon:yes stop_codon:yes gene_type:complete